MKSKADYRQLFKRNMEELSDLTAKEESNNLCDLMKRQSYYQKAELIGLFIPKGKEVDATPLIEAAWDAGKHIAVPKVIKGTREMTFYSITSFKELEPTFFGLFEPKPDQCQKVDPSQIDLMIVPGLGFDNAGYRIGYGGGYYDTYLKSYDGVTAALAYSCQLVDKLPTEAHDQKVDHLLAPDGVLL
ncbi:5-formyltetrahydrofolate cyclo-ligase [Alkalihalophilus marmarensis]|uniref:5-formyltetrahydrofolate cyclo-ligase n=1 Tax=Alkalihalophilus marmarensis TaxID=521377 RepID=UPI002DB883CF|nr:5-formyltetrahydrofolate cyclo-ligase [Alkalihalophilus marmarensis]MEC2070527.1 5-formyltetrahydrofolate cyclo-ligase [Alkalihalophilus marmarensis]